MKILKKEVKGAKIDVLCTLEPFQVPFGLLFAITKYSI